jgi:AraC-like DNA-binding protein
VPGVLYDLDVAACRIEAWTPAVPGIAEVFHASIEDWGYPRHCHDTWAVLIVDAGAIRYGLGTRECYASAPTVTILPPGVVHDGRPAPGIRGFRKREIYLEPDLLPASLVGPAVDRSGIDDVRLRTAISALHDALTEGTAGLDGETRLVMIIERIRTHLERDQRMSHGTEAGIAIRFRELLDAQLTEPVSLGQAAELLGRSGPHLVRSFTRKFGISPHAYLISRRIDAARRELLRGTPAAEVATATGFYDQAHFTRHFKRHTALTPAQFANSATGK